MSSQEWADQLETEESGEERRPLINEFSPEVEAIRSLENQIRVMRSEAVSIASGKAGPEVQFLKGPQTVIDDLVASAKYKKRAREHYSLAARLLPHRREELLAKADQE